MKENQDSKEWANPTAAGLVAHAVACVSFFAMLTGNVETSALPLIGCWLIGGFVIQLVVGLLELKSDNHGGGNTFLFFSAFFLLVGGLEMLLKHHAITNGAPLDATIDGFTWSVLSLVIILWTPAFCKTINLFTLIVLCLDVALPFIALADLGVIARDFTLISAWALLLSAVIAIYLCAALVVNTAYEKTVYPVLSVDRKQKQD